MKPPTRRESLLFQGIAYMTASDAREMGRKPRNRKQRRRIERLIQRAIGKRKR